MSTIKSSDEHLTLNADGASKDIKLQSNASEKVIIKSDGKFGIGTSSPSVNVHIVDDASEGTPTFAGATHLAVQATASSTDNVNAALISGSAGTSRIMFGDKDDEDEGKIEYSNSTNAMTFTANDSERMRIDSSGNVGIGVTPESDWGSRNVLQFGLGASISGRTGSVDLEVSRNAKYTGNNPTSTGKYINADQACMYRQNGDHSFHVAPSGTADAAITWTEALTITNDGRGLSQFTAKAWANFNGTGTPAFRDSHNFSSITDTTTGTYRVNFTNAMANGNYCAVASGDAIVTWQGAGTHANSTTTGYVGIKHVENGTNQDTAVNSVLVFGD